MSETNLKRLKRRPRVDVEETWECTACTYKNPKESFKCEVCDTRKGTSTRKPKLTNSVIQMQEQLEKVFSKDKDEDNIKKKKEPLLKVEIDDNKNQFTTYFKKIKGLDRQNFEKVEVTSNGFSVVITEYTNKGTPNTKSQSKPISNSSSVSSSLIKNDKLTANSTNHNNNSSRNIWSIAVDNIGPSHPETSMDTSNSLSSSKYDGSSEKSKQDQFVESYNKNKND